MRVAALMSVSRNTSTVALVFALLGSPITTLACVARWVPDAARTTASCHEEPGAQGATGVKNANDACARLFVVSPFLIEEPQAVTSVAATVGDPLPSSFCAPGKVQPTIVLDIGTAAPNRSILSLVLRL